MNQRLMLLLSAAILALTVWPTMAQAPLIEVNDQVAVDDSVVVSNVVSEGPGFIAIHADENGQPGLVIGHAPVQSGPNSLVRVPIDRQAATPLLYAVLHVDDTQVGVYEFATSPEADLPVMVEGQMVAAPFNIKLIAAPPQFLSNNTLIVQNVVTDGAGFVVVQTDSGEVLGYAAVEAGNTEFLAVPLSGSITDVLWATLHYDTGEIGVFEFGTVEGEDLPVLIDGLIPAVPVPTIQTIVAEDQVVVHGQNLPAVLSAEPPASQPVPHIAVDAVLARGAAWVVAYQNVDGALGELVGLAPVQGGLTQDLQIQVDASLLTPHIWLRLHEDTGNLGGFEFGESNNLDIPVRRGDHTDLQVRVNVMPSLSYTAKSLSQDSLVIDRVVIDANGWLVIRGIVDGEPGPILGFSPVTEGLNNAVSVLLDFSDTPEVDSAEVVATLHYDTGTLGQFEYSTDQELDQPILLSGVELSERLALLEN